MKLVDKLKQKALPIAIVGSMTLSGITGFANAQTDYGDNNSIIEECDSMDNNCDDEKCGFDYTIGDKSFYIEKECTSEEEDSEYNKNEEKGKLSVVTINKQVRPKEPLYIGCSEAGPGYKAVSIDNFFNNKVCGVIDARDEMNGCVFYNKSFITSFQVGCNCLKIE